MDPKISPFRPIHLEKDNPKLLVWATSFLHNSNLSLATILRQHIIRIFTRGNLLRLQTFILHSQKFSDIYIHKVHSCVVRRILAQSLLSLTIIIDACSSWDKAISWRNRFTHIISSSASVAANILRFSCRECDTLQQLWLLWYDFHGKSKHISVANFLGSRSPAISLDNIHSN